MKPSARILYLDQNAWIALAKGAWDSAAYPAQHAALTFVARAIEKYNLVVPLSFANIYETSKINDPVRRRHLAYVQSTISGGKVIRGRHRILEETLLKHIANRASIDTHALPSDWFISTLWFESAADYTSNRYGFEIPERVLELIQKNPAEALFIYLNGIDDDVRRSAVQKYSEGSAELIKKLEARRQLVSSDSFAMRRRVYSARLLIDEIDLVFMIAKRLNLPWSNVGDIGRTLLKSFATDVPVLNVEIELAIRLEDQHRATTENDLRDMASFITALPLVDILVAEKPFVNLARQARLGEKYRTVLLTSVSELDARMLSGSL